MKVSDLVVEVRDADLVRLGQLTPADLVGFQAVLRFNDIGSWKCVLPVGNRWAELLKQPGAGLIVTTSQGTLISGPTTSVVTNQSIDDIEGTYEISGLDDSVLLKERLAYPTPTTADVGAQTSAYDERTGLAEDVMKAYVLANIGENAPAVRQVPHLTVQASAGLGVAVDGSARFETLQELLKGLADVSGLGYTIEQVGDSLEFQVYEPVDRSANVRLDLQNGRLRKSEYSYSQPKATRAIVGGDGDDAARVFVETTTAESQEAEVTWNRRIEVFNDQRSTVEIDKLLQAGREQLITDGKTVITVSISPNDDQTMLFGVDWNLGDKVSVVVGNTELRSVVTEVGLLVGKDGVRIGATVGEPQTLDYETQVISRMTKQALRISQLERRK